MIWKGISASIRVTQKADVKKVLTLNANDFKGKWPEGEPRFVAP
jgi:hypothetical protein